MGLGENRRIDFLGLPPGRKFFVREYVLLAALGGAGLAGSDKNKSEKANSRRAGHLETRRELLFCVECRAKVSDAEICFIFWR